MCGFIGNFGCHENYTKNAFHKIVHRGPDHQSINSNKNWNVEFCRLSINDLSSDGNQPFELGKITSFVNGEIYNANLLKKKYFSSTKFISKSDSEIIPHMYNKFGIDFIQFLDGMFSIVIIDDLKNKIYLIKDSFGKKPLYYKKDDKSNCIIFSSESRINNEKSQLNKKNLKTLLYFQFKFFDQSIYKDINSIPPGSYLEYDNKKLNIVKWYQPKICKVPKQNIEKIFLKLFNKAIKKRLMADVMMGVFLSGGIDSNLIATSLYQQTGKKITTFSAIIKDKKISEGSDTDTIESIKSSIKGLDCENIFIEIDQNYINNNLVKIIVEADHPIIDSSYIIAYACAERAKEYNNKVVFTGIGADESFGGYSWQSRYKNNFSFINQSIKFLSNFNKYFIKSDNKYLNYLFFPNFLHTSSLGLQYWKSKDLNFIQSAKQNTHDAICNYTKLNGHIFKQDFKNFLDFINLYGVINHQVTVFDLACMLNSVENRSPFLDRELFEFSLSIPSNCKKKDKALLKSISKTISPTEVLKKPKSGPTINFAILFEDEKFLNLTKQFIIKNIYIIENYVSINLAEKINKSFNLLYSENYLPLISIINLIIWIKFNIEKSISKNISLRQLLES